MVRRFLPFPKSQKSQKLLTNAVALGEGVAGRALADVLQKKNVCHLTYASDTSTASRPDEHFVHNIRIYLGALHLRQRRELVLLHRLLVVRALRRDLPRHTVISWCAPFCDFPKRRASSSFTWCARSARFPKRRPGAHRAGVAIVGDGETLPVQVDVLERRARLGAADLNCLDLSKPRGI